MTEPIERPDTRGTRGTVRQLLAVLLIAGAAAATEAVAADPPPDSQRVQGSWLVISGTVAGNDINLADMGNDPPTGSIEGDVVRFEFKGEELVTLRLKFGATPHAPGASRWWGQVDGTIAGLVPASGWYLYQPAETPDGVEFLAINVGQGANGRIDKFDRENLRFVMTRSGRTRLVDELARPDAAPLGAAGPADDLGRLQGKWTLESSDGKPVPPRIVHEFRKDRFIKPLKYNDGTGGVDLDFGLAVRGNLDPKQIDMNIKYFGKRQGIFKFEKDRLVMCIAGVGEPRPKRFAPDPATRAELVVYRRATAEEARGDAPPEGATLSDLMAAGAVWGGTLRVPYRTYTGSIAYDVLFRINRRNGDRFEGTVTRVNQKEDIPVKGRIEGEKVVFDAGATPGGWQVEFVATRVGLSIGGGPRDSRFEVRYLRKEGAGPR